MRKWIGLVTGIVCVLSSSLIADDVLATPVEAAQVENAAAPAAIDTNEEQAPKQVGKASADSTNTAKSSTAAKYALAAGAVAIGITALILVSRHHGHHH